VNKIQLTNKHFNC